MAEKFSKFFDRDEIRLEYFFEDNYLTEIKVDLRDKDIFPKADTKSKRVFLRWLSWMNNQIVAALEQAPYKGIEEKIPKKDLDLTEDSFKSEALQKKPRDTSVVMRPDYKSSSKEVTCPHCGNWTVGKEACCDSGEYYGICENCKKRYRVKLTGPQE
jgi:predicted RNA-binding Zn-ribbon protein involved in translation (DUF1610 family)